MTTRRRRGPGRGPGVLVKRVRLPTAAVRQLRVARLRKCIADIECWIEIRVEDGDDVAFLRRRLAALREGLDEAVAEWAASLR